MNEINVVTQAVLRLGFALAKYNVESLGFARLQLAYGSLERTVIFKILGNTQRRSLKRRKVRLSEHKRRKSGLCSLSVRLAHA